MGILLLLLFVWWRFEVPANDMDTMGPGANTGLEVGPDGELRMFADEGNPPPKSATEKNVGRPPGPEPRNKRKKKLGHEPKEKTKSAGKKSEPAGPKQERYKWIAVDEFGQALADSSWVLFLGGDALGQAVEVETDSEGRFNLLSSKVPAGATFKALLCKDVGLVVEPLGQEVHEPLLRELVVRVVKKGRLQIRLTQADGKPSELAYTALLSAPGQSMHAFIPEFISEQSLQANIDMEVGPGNYELVLVPEKGIHHVVVAADGTPVQVQIQPGGTGSIQIQEPEWNLDEWSIGMKGPHGSMVLATINSPGSLQGSLHVMGDTAPRWRTAVIPETSTSLHLLPKPTIAHVYGNESGHKLAFLFGKLVIFLQGPGDERTIRLGAFAGPQIFTQVRSLTRLSDSIDVMRPKPEDVDGKLSVLAPNWIEVEAEYANDVAWKRTLARIQVLPNSKDFKVSSNIDARILKLSPHKAGRVSPPADLGLRWSYMAPKSQISGLTVDLLPSVKLFLDVPIPKHPDPDFLGILSWTPRAKPGVLGIGQWSAHPNHLRKNKPPGFRTFQLHCIQHSGVPAPFAMVQIRGEDENITWRGSADANGLLRLEVLGSGPFWIDSDLVQNPVQIQLHDKSPESKTLALMVPMRHNPVDLLVSSEEKFDLSQLKVRLSLWKQPKEFPGRIYPDLAEGHLNAEGKISFQSLVPALYRIELFDPRSTDPAQSRKVRIRDRDAAPQIMMHWQP